MGVCYGRAAGACGLGAAVGGADVAVRCREAVLFLLNVYINVNPNVQR